MFLLVSLNSSESSPKLREKVFQVLGHEDIYIDLADLLKMRRFARRFERRGLKKVV